MHWVDSLRLFAHRHYNSSMCGGAIYLPEPNDSVSFNFDGTMLYIFTLVPSLSSPSLTSFLSIIYSGSDFQLEFVIQETSDARNITVSPDDIGSSEVGLNHLGELDSSLDCSNRDVDRNSASINGQLFKGNHTITVKNGGASGWEGTGVIITSIA